MPPTSGMIRFEDHFNRAQEFSTTPGHNGWTIKDTSASGTPTYLTITEDGGAAKLTLAATSEAEVVTLYQNNVLPIDLAKLKRFAVVAKVADVNSVTTIVVGLGNAQNDTPDSVGVHCWFKIDGSASTENLVIETDDTVTDDDDNATGVTLGSTYKRLEMDFSNGLSDIRFYVDGQPVGSGTFSLAGVTAGQNVQPFIQIQKASGTGTPSITIAEVEYDEAYSYGS